MDFIHAFLNFFSLENIFQFLHFLYLIFIKIISLIIWYILLKSLFSFIKFRFKKEAIKKYPDLLFEEYNKIDFSPLYPKVSSDTTTHNLKNTSNIIYLTRRKKYDFFFIWLLIFLTYHMIQYYNIGIFLIFVFFFLLIFYFYYENQLKIKDIIFDFESGYFYKISLVDRFLKRDFLRMWERFDIYLITWIQVIKKEIPQWSASLECYELNILLKNSLRINILNHVNLREISNTAAILWKRIWVNIYDETTLYYD